MTYSDDAFGGQYPLVQVTPEPENIEQAHDLSEMSFMCPCIPQVFVIPPVIAIIHDDPGWAVEGTDRYSVLDYIKSVVEKGSWDGEKE